MSDLIDREAVEKMLVEMLLNNLLPELVDELRSLPAAVPVCDVARAAKAYLNTLRYLDAHEAEKDGVHIGYARAILYAGYAGSVSKEDVLRVCDYAFATLESDRKEHMAATRLLAAVEGKP